MDPAPCEGTFGRRVLCRTAGHIPLEQTVLSPPLSLSPSPTTSSSLFPGCTCTQTGVTKALAGNLCFFKGFQKDGNSGCGFSCGAAPRVSISPLSVTLNDPTCARTPADCTSSPLGATWGGGGQAFRGICRCVMGNLPPRRDISAEDSGCLGADTRG